MKILIFILFFTTAAQASLMSPFESSVDGISIPNAHDISKDGNNILVRGQRPYIDGNKKFSPSDPWSRLSQDTKNWLDQLFRGGSGRVTPFTDILIFKKGGDKEIANQMAAIEKMMAETRQEINVVRIKFPWKDVGDYQKTCEDTVEALLLMKEVSESGNRSLFLHCTVGEDRTGLLSALWRMLDQGWSRWKAFDEEMCARGYGQGNPNKPYKVYKEIREDLTPLYMEMADLIRTGVLTYQNLNDSVCSHFRGFDPVGYDIRHYTCEPQTL